MVAPSPPTQRPLRAAELQRPPKPLRGRARKTWSAIDPRVPFRACKHGDRACKHGERACKHGERACKHGDRACKHGDRACKHGDRACKRGDRACKHGPLPAVRVKRL